MPDATHECMHECEKKYAKYLKPIRPAQGQSYDAAKAIAKEPLIKLLIESGCRSELDRKWFETMEPLGLVREICGCECTEIYPSAKRR